MTDTQAPNEITEDAGMLPAAYFALSVGLGAMSVFLHVNDCAFPPEGACASEMAERVADNLIAIGVANPPAPDELSRIVSSALESADPGVGIKLVEGKPAVEPVDGRIEWMEDYFATGYAVNSETGQMDYWQKLGNRVVHEGQLIARVHPPREGVPGATVFGMTIPVTKAAEAAMRVGDGVERVEKADVSEFVATADGRFRWIDDTLSVDDILVQEGDVGIETGNITHPGALEIRGDIKEGVTVSARGDIIVHGSVEPSTILSKGSLIVHGGLVGREDSSIHVGGSVLAKYLLGAHVVAGGDVEVVGEIQRSYVRAAGRVGVPKGRISGGVTIAGCGIEVGCVGTDGGSDTALVCNPDQANRPVARETACIEVRNKMVSGTHLAIGAISYRTESTVRVHCRVLLRDGRIDVEPLSG